MRRSFRHRPINVVSSNNGSADSAENGNNENGPVENNEIGPTEEGSQRKKRGRTELKRPPAGQRILIKPLGEE